VLRRVGQTGSISQAAREAGISYKAAWQAIDTLTNLSGANRWWTARWVAAAVVARASPRRACVAGLADQLAAARQQVLAVSPVARNSPVAWGCASMAVAGLLRCDQHAQRPACPACWG
jgi:molybdate transport system regulatory protein